MKVSVKHWAYNDGWSHTQDLSGTNLPVAIFRAELTGWHCWAYTDDHAALELWMRQNMQGEYDCTRRFNSGSIMSTIAIRDEQDATIFKLKWL